MEPISPNPQSGRAGAASTSANPSAGITHSDNVPPADSTFSTTAAHATGDNPMPVGNADKPAASGVQDKLNTALESGKKWLSDSGLAEQAQQLPQTVKDFGTKSWTSITGLTTTQKAVGIGLLTVGVAFLATRGKSKKHGEYRDKPRKSPFSGPKSKPYDYGDGRSVDRPGQRPWGSNRYGNAASSPAGGGARVSSGSGYGSAASGVLGGRPMPGRNAGPGVGGSSQGTSGRRDQGPASGSQYDAGTSGGQNPNNLDQLNSAY